MDQPRIDPLTQQDARAAAAELGLPDSFADLTVFRIALRDPSTAKALHGLLVNLLFGARLAPRLRELVILRIAWRTGAAYQWTQHWDVALRLRVPAEDVAGVREWASYDGFDERDRAVLAATDEVLASGVMGDSTWAQCRAVFDDDAVMVELVAVIGAWTLIANFLRSLAIPLDEDMAVWPPDGRAPTR
jgi:alkylhydroperoxidase family enzyme